MKAIVYFFSFFLITISLNSQELDPDFLDSLPNDIKKDLIDKNSEQDLKTKENYKPYLYSSKLRQSEEILSLKERLEIDLLELERRLDLDGEFKNNKELILYGSDFFNSFQTSFMPINEPNPDSDYVLDVGDVINIQMVGQKNSNKKFNINRDGSIILDDVGQIILAGLKLNQAYSLIQSKVNSTYISTEAFVTLSDIRDVNVLITGNAENPGIYTLSGNSNILHAISAAGGISEYGSYREINLIRNDKVIETLDMYDLLINGQYNLKKRLRSGDVVFVEKRKSIVAIDGAVFRPAKYEILDNQNLYSIIEFANGLTKTADTQNISLERILDGSLKTIPVVNESQFKTIKAVDGDLIYIREHPFREAKIFGAVAKPGTYIMASGESINDLINKAGGITDNAYLFGSIYINEDAKKINEEAKNKLYEEFLDNIIAISQRNVGQNFDITPIISLAKDIKSSKASGRVVVDIENDQNTGFYKIKDGDSLYIPESTNVVYVYGETSAEGAVMFTEGKGINYYINKSGGFKKYAEKQSIYVLHPNGESELFSSKRNIFESSPASKTKIYPGSVIFVPKKLDNSTSRLLASQAYVSILGNLGIALASLSSINNNN